MKNTFTLPKSRSNVFAVISLFMLCLFAITPVMSVYADCCYDLEDDLEEAEEALEEAEEAYEDAQKTLEEALRAENDTLINLATENLRKKREAKEAAESDVYWAEFWLMVCQTTDHWYGTYLGGGCESGGCD